MFKNQILKPANWHIPVRRVLRMRIGTKLYHRLKGYKDLLFVFIWREFSIRYKQSLIGILWAILQPVSMMLLFTFIFTYVMPMRVTKYPYILFFYAGLLPWSFFSSSLNYSIPSLTNHYNLVTKIYFPREVLPISGIAVAVVDFLCAAAFYFVLLLIYGHKITSTFWWFIPLFFLLIVFTTAVGLLLACINVYYRDVKLATNFMLKIWFFCTPVFYSIDKVSLKLKFLLFLNPLSFIVENMRRCVLENRGVILWQFLIFAIFVVLLFEGCYKVFIKTERKFADVI